MDDQQMIEYVTTNFHTLPKDILLKLLGMMSTKDVIALCSTERGLRRECERIGAYKRVLEREAPLAEANYGPIEQIHLIDRGFSTLYSADLNVNKLTNVKFGFPYYYTDVDRAIFEIRGMPPARGTKVWIAGVPYEPSEMSDWRPNGLMVYENRKAALEFMAKYDESKSDINNVYRYIHDILLDARRSNTNTTLNDLIVLFDKGENLDEMFPHFTFQEVILP